MDTDQYLRLFMEPVLSILHADMAMPRPLSLLQSHQRPLPNPLRRVQLLITHSIHASRVLTLSAISVTSLIRTYALTAHLTSTTSWLMAPAPAWPDTSPPQTNAWIAGKGVLAASSATIMTEPRALSPITQPNSPAQNAITLSTTSSPARDAPSALYSNASFA